MIRRWKTSVCSLAASGLLVSSITAQERSISLLPPVGRAAGGGVVTSPIPQTELGWAPAPYVPPAQGGTLGRGAHLPLRNSPLTAVIPAKAETLEEPPTVAPPSTPAPAPSSGPSSQPALSDAASTIGPAPTLSIEMPLPTWPAFGCGSLDVLGLCAEPRLPSDVDDPTWMHFEYLIWGFTDGKLPPIVTTSLPESLGVLDRPDTRVIFGGDVTLPEKFGFRIGAGSWFEPTESFGLEASYLVLFNQTRFFEKLGVQGEVLARPFFNVLTGQQDSAPFTNPIGPNFGPTEGGIIAGVSGRMQIVEVNALSNYCRGQVGRIDWIYGLRYMSIIEWIDIRETLKTPIDATGAGGTAFHYHDQFDTGNYYLGGQVGLRAEKSWGRWTIGGSVKLGVGYMYERAEIQGGTFLFSPTVPWQFFPGGFLAQPSNIGKYRNDSFAFVPELGLRLSWQVKDHIQAFVGYNLLYVSNVLRPGEIMDTRINPLQFAPPATIQQGPVFPEPRLRETGFLAHGVSFGLEIRY